ncbi:MAG: thioredoxin [Prolixibacteraceae bacterium]|nr:thioredoxin [Prolixibacteraceae bacterium]
MSATLIIIVGALVALIGLITFNFYRMKNAKPVTDSQKIVVLGKKNFQPVVRRGITLVDFWAPWCNPCKVVAPILNDIAGSEEDITIGKVNVDQQQFLARKFNVRNIPTLIMFQNGVEVKRFVGVKTRKFLLKQVDELRA